MTDKHEKILDKLKKMYAHAKSAKAIGSEAEAQTFAAKIQELLSRHKIDLSEIEYERLNETDPIRRKLVDFESANVQVKKRRIAWQEDIAGLVCRAYFCKLIVISGSSSLYFVGRGIDLEAAEQVFLYLIKVVGNLANKAYVVFFYEARDIGHVELARGFRKNYLDGFSQRLAERYDEERERLRQEYAINGMALIRLTDALKAVEQFLIKEARTKKAPRVGRTSRARNDEGYRRGRRDANMLPIGQNQKQIAPARQKEP